MQYVEESVWVPAPRERVWGRYTDHLSWTVWAGIGKVRLVSRGSADRDGVGCVRAIANLGVEVEEEVTEFEAPLYMAYRVIRGGLPMKNHLGEVSFEERDDGTMVEWRCRFESRIPFCGLPMKWIVQRVFRRVLANLERQSRAESR